MVELQIVVLAVAGSSPVGHPPDGTRTQFDYPREAPPPEQSQICRAPACAGDNPVGHPPDGTRTRRGEFALAPFLERQNAGSE